MAEPTGRLKVVIIQGKSLVIRDFRSSDPYVVVKLGKQVINSQSRNAVVFSSRFRFVLAFAIDDNHLTRDSPSDTESENKSHQKLPESRMERRTQFHARLRCSWIHKLRKLFSNFARSIDIDRSLCFAIRLQFCHNRSRFLRRKCSTKISSSLTTRWDAHTSTFSMFNLLLG